MNRSLRTTIILVICAVGSWHMTTGTWIFMKARLAQYLFERAWAKTVSSSHQVRPWPWADTWPVARLYVPRHGIDMFVLSDASGRTLAFGPGHVSNSARPGTYGTAILNGHRDTHFRFLKHLKKGDTIVIERPDGEPIAFSVYEMNVVDARKAVIRQDRSQPHLVLITCFPFDAITPGGPLRYIVSGEPLSSFHYSRFQ